MLALFDVTIWRWLFSLIRTTCMGLVAILIFSFNSSASELELVSWSSSRDTKVHIKIWMRTSLLIDGSWAVEQRQPHKDSAFSLGVVKPLRGMCFLAQLSEARTSCSNTDVYHGLPTDNGLVWWSGLKKQGVKETTFGCSGKWWHKATYWQEGKYMLVDWNDKFGDWQGIVNDWISPKRGWLHFSEPVTQEKQSGKFLVTFTSLPSHSLRLI